MTNKVIYTSIFGNYDDLKTPEIYDDDVDYKCFTDNTSIESDVWEIIIIKAEVSKNSSKSSKFVKICPHKFLSEYKYSLYIDGSMTLINNIDMVKLLNGKKLAMELHQRRDCVYKEAKACKRLKKDKPSIINEQIRRYKQLKFPRHAGLRANGVMIREHNDPQLINLNECWWQQVLRYSRRDQLSFPFVFLNYPIESIPMSTRESFIRMSRHKKANKR